MHIKMPTVEKITVAMIVIAMMDFGLLSCSSVIFGESRMEICWYGEVHGRAAAFVLQNCRIVFNAIIAS